MLRCAFCHDRLAAPAWTCVQCATRLHEDCRELAGICPILGCEPRFRLSIRPARETPRGASASHLCAWLTILGGIWTALVWLVPRVTKIFEKKKQILPVPTQALCWLQHFAPSGVGIAITLALVAGSIVAFWRLRERPATRYAFIALAAIGLLFVPFALMAIILPLANIAKV
jgi:hypothetical protein